MAAVLLSTFFFADSLGCMASEFFSYLLFMRLAAIWLQFFLFLFFAYSLGSLSQSNKCLNFVVEDVEDSWLYGRSFSVLYFYASLGSMADKIFHDIEFRDVNDS